MALIGVAKGPDRDAGGEHFHIARPQRADDAGAARPVLYFVQRLRDEAHRFAIGTHRAKQAKALGANPLDKKSPASAPVRAPSSSTSAPPRRSTHRRGGPGGRARLDHAQMAQTIYDFFHERPDT